MKQIQGHQTSSDNVDPKQGYHHAKFERSCFNEVRGKNNGKFVLKWGTMPNYLSWMCVKVKKRKKEKVVYIYIFIMYLTDLTIQPDKVLI